MTRPARLKALSLLLILCLLLQYFPALPVVAEETAPSDTALPATVPAQPLTEQCRILDHVDADVFASGNHVARLPEEEQLYSYVFQNADGSKTVYYMDQAVKFVDANGIVQEKNLTLTAVASDLTPNAMGITPTAGYTTASNDVGLHLPLSPADGIRLSYGAKNITVIPQGGDSGVIASVDGNSIVYRDYYGPGMSLVYTPDYTGVKEDIVLSAYTGVTEFTFTLRTNGLNLYQANGRYFLAASKTATERFDLGDVVAFDANGRFSVGSMTVKTVMPGQAYTITLSVSEEYLTAPDTIYPVRIDPTITVNSANNAAVIEDASIYQLMPNTNANWPFMHCGYYSTAYGIGKIMVRLPGLYSDSTYQTLTPDRIQAATFHIKEATGKAAHTIQLRAHIGNDWTESGATWNSVGTSLGPVYATASVGPNAVAQFDIKQLVIDWIEEERIDTKGFVLTHSDENNATKGFCSSEYTTTGYRPYVTVTYENPTTAPSLQEYEIEIPLGEDYTITVNNEIGTPTFTSANELIASVNSSGTVCGDNAGSTTIAVNVDGYTLYCVVHVVMDNGTYRISSRSANLPIGTSGSIGNGTLLTTVAPTTENPAHAFQLWQITHVIGAQYTIRPYYKQDMALTVLNGAVVLQQIGFDNAAVLAEHRWEISYTSSGYTLKHAGANNSALKTYNGGSNSGISIGIGTYSSDSYQYHWSLNTALGAPRGALLYDAETDTLLTTAPTEHLALEEGKSLGTLGLKAISYPANTSAAYSFTWSVSNSNASYSSITNQFTGVSAGDTTVTGTSANGSVTFNLTIHPVANGTYYIRNRASKKHVDISNQDMNANTTIYQWSYTGSNSQFWTFKHLGDGTFTIQSANSATKFYLGVRGDSTANYQPIVLRTGAITNGMKWRITQTTSGTYKLIPMTGGTADHVLALNADDNYSALINGLELMQRDFGDDLGFTDEWYLSTIVDIGFSTDNYETKCSCSERQSYRYANKFYDELIFQLDEQPVTKLHHYNYGSTMTASKMDFSINGAISNSIDFMIYIGHGHKAHDSRGNHLHFSCSTGHSNSGGNCEDIAYNAYTSELRFGSDNSDLRWVWLYTCNFLTTGEYVTDDMLKEMMNGVHIVMGYASQSMLCDANAQLFAECLRNGETIISSFFYAGKYGEATATSDHHIQKVLYIPQAEHETIYSTPYHYDYDPDDVMVITSDIQSTYN